MLGVEPVGRADRDDVKALFSAQHLLETSIGSRIVLARQRLGAFRKYIACTDERTDVGDVLRVPGCDASAPDNREGKIRPRWPTGFHIRHCWLHRVG